jgi:hypothetical protein
MICRAPIVSVSLAAVVSCGGGSSTRSTVSNTPAPAGDRCPTPDRVRIAAYTSSTAGSWDREEAPHWRMPLAIRELDPYNPDKPIGPAVPATVEELKANGVATLPATVTMYWASARGVEPPCTATVGTPYSAVGGDGFPFEELGVELDGCPGPNDGDTYLAWVSLDEAPGCTFVSAVEDGVRRFDGERWDGRPTGHGALPAELAAFVPPNPRGAMPDALLWETRAARSGSRVLAWELASGHITSPPGTDACSVESDVSIQHFAVIGSRAVPSIERGNPEAWAHLDGVLVQGDAPRVMILRGVGTYTAIGIAADGAPTAPRTTQWYIPHDEDTLGIDIVPYCGP